MNGREYYHLDKCKHAVLRSAQTRVENQYKHIVKSIMNNFQIDCEVSNLNFLMLNVIHTVNCLSQLQIVLNQQ